MSRLFKRMFASIIVRSWNHKRPWTVSWVKTSGKANTRFTGVRKSHEFELMILALLSISNIPDVEPQLSVINLCNVCACCNLFIQILVKIDRSGRSIRTPNTECRMVVLKLFELDHSMFNKTNLAHCCYGKFQDVITLRREKLGALNPQR